MRIAVDHRLEALLARIRERKRGYKVISTRLIVNERGRAMSVAAMSRRWAKACQAAGISGIQFRDLRAKAGTDTTEHTGNLRDAQKQLGHKNISTTEIYVRKRLGDKPQPTPGNPLRKNKANP